MTTVEARKLQLIDGIGALISAFLLAVVLPRFQEFIGIPLSMLYVLAAIPCLFAAYDFYQYDRHLKDYSNSLRYIAYANVGYCVLSLGMAFWHMDVMTIWGWTYILAEVLLVFALAIMEVKVANL